MNGRPELRGGPAVRGLDPAAEARAEAGEAYRAVLDPLEDRPGVAAIERVWAFPPRDIRGVPVALIVASAFAEEEGRRHLITSRVVVGPMPEGAPRSREPETSVEVARQAVVPADRVRRVLEGVVRRLGVDLSDEAPADFAIDGDEDAWADMREVLHAIAPPPPPAATPRDDSLTGAAREDSSAPRTVPGDALPAPIEASP